MGVEDRHRRFYCKNVSGCGYARSDRPFGFEIFQSGKGLCVGLKNDGCGQPLVESEPYNPWPGRIAGGAAVAVLVASGGVAIRHWVFPPPLRGISFAVEQTRVEDSTDTSVVHVKLARTDGSDQSAVVRYRAEAVTAVPVKDFDPASGAVRFDPGQEDAEITVMVHPDPANEMPDRSLALVLTNVEGAPRHLVTLVERKVDAGDEERLKIVVRSGSRLAKDIADQTVRRRVFSELVVSSRHDEALFREAQKRLQDAQDDLARVRENYVEVLGSLKAFQPSQVVKAIAAVSAEQEKAGFHQQSQATALMKDQFEEFRKDGRPYLDKWSEELARVVPTAPKSDGARVI